MGTLASFSGNCHRIDRLAVAADYVRIPLPESRLASHSSHIARRGGGERNCDRIGNRCDERRDAMGLSRTRRKPCPLPRLSRASPFAVQWLFADTTPGEGISPAEREVD